MLAVPVRLVRQVNPFWWGLVAALVIGPWYMRYLAWVLTGCVEFAQ
mgnify:CR=1 FL=1